MKHFDEFVWTGQNIKTWEPFAAMPFAVGCVILSFAGLRDEITARILDLITIRDFDAWMSAGARSFDNRLSLLGTLVRTRLETGGWFNIDFAPPLEYWSELEARCRLAISLWDCVVNSSGEPLPCTGRVTHLPVVGKLLPTGKSVLNESEVMDIAVMISCVTGELDHFFSGLNRPPGRPARRRRG